MQENLKPAHVYLLTAAALVLILLYPPAELYSPAERDTRIGDYIQPGSPETRTSTGFMFIGDVKYSFRIRYAQWAIQIGGALAVGMVLAKAAESSGTTKKT